MFVLFALAIAMAHKPTVDESFDSLQNTFVIEDISEGLNIASLSPTISGRLLELDEITN